LITTGQKNCEGFIIDKVTGNRIPYATVGLIKENKGVSANGQGAFSINALLPKVDSLRISSVGYKTMMLPVSEWANGGTVALEQTPSLLREVIISTNQEKRVYTLNRFRSCSWNTFGTGLKAIYQLAQRFEAPEQWMQLTDLELCKDQGESIFRIRIYDIDSASQAPSKDLVDTVIEITSSEKHVQVNLEQYHIIIPSKNFFVAIEWLFVPFNEEFREENRNGRKTGHVYYRPFIRWVTNRKAKEGNVWLLHFDGK
jgi:hypothetical protein